jgi:hypothetical protein
MQERMVIDMAEKTNTKAQTKAVIETDTGAKPINHVQEDEFYELPSVSNVPAAPKEEVIAPVPEVSNDTVDLAEHKTGKPTNTTAGQLDLAIDRYHKLQAEAESDTVVAKLDLLNRLDTLAQEADKSVQDKIAMIRAAL